MYRVQLTKQAEKTFETIMVSQPKMGARIAQAIDRLANDPTIGVSLKADLKGCYKYRVGSYRIIYQIEHSVLLVVVIDIGHRKEVYR